MEASHGNKTTTVPITTLSSSSGTLGGHLARRLVQIGVHDVFSVPGDFNLTLLDYLVAEPGLNLVGCCNELNAAMLLMVCKDAKGVGAVLVTILILHHTIGLPDFTQEMQCFSTVTCAQGRFGGGGKNNLEDAHEQIDTAISTALKESKPIEQPFRTRGSSGRDSEVFKQGRKTGHCSRLQTAGCKGTKGFLNFVGEIVESADAYIFVGPIFNDYSSVGYSLLIKKEKSIIVQPNRVTIGNGSSLGWVFMADFLSALAKKLKKNSTAMENYHRIFVPNGVPLKCEKDEPLRVNILFKHIQEMLTGETAVIAETVMNSKCSMDQLMSFGATLGYAQAAKDKRVIACIGDGSFQVTAQDISTMIRCGQNTIIFLINNGGYSIEVEIHDGPYNVIKNWDYTGLVNAIHNGEGKCWTSKVRTEEELVEAIATATGAEKDSLCFIEIFAHKDDTSKELLEWGSRVSAANSRPPNPQ
ncbi:pyruvate decarboxylase 1 [Tanacetum coccineum]